jgi:hypothetical protein
MCPALSIDQVDFVSGLIRDQKGMKILAVMQPYLFPYMGYWQLIRAVDRFVIYDDVNYIKGGWVNRNRILINGQPSYITVPLQQSSQNKRICDLSLDSSLVWRNKLVKAIEISYRRAPFFSEFFPVTEQLIRYEESNLAGYLANQLKVLCHLMGIDTEFVLSSRSYGNSDLSAQARVMDICQRESASIYINSPGGKALYDAQSFHAAGVGLRFIAMRPIPYKQRHPGFIPYLSIIDALMEVGPSGIAHHLDAYDLVNPHTLYQ